MHITITWIVAIPLCHWRNACGGLCQVWYFYINYHDLQSFLMYLCYLICLLFSQEYTVCKNESLTWIRKQFAIAHWLQTSNIFYKKTVYCEKLKLHKDTHSIKTSLLRVVGWSFIWHLEMSAQLESEVPFRLSKVCIRNGVTTLKLILRPNLALNKEAANENKPNVCPIRSLSVRSPDKTRPR